MIVGGLDIETSGLEQGKGHRIIEIAILPYLYDETTGVATPKGKFVQRINPQRSIDPAAHAVHGISYEDLAHCPTWEEVAPKVVRLMSACNLLVAHNGDGFDLPFIAAELLRIGQAVPEIATFDTMLNFRHATPMGKLPNLRELCFACGVEYDTELAHAAEYDVAVMMKCFFHMNSKGFVNLDNCL